MSDAGHTSLLEVIGNDPASLLDADAIAFAASRVRGLASPEELPLRSRYNWLCYLVTRKRWTEAAEVLREVAVDPELAKRARSDPSVLPLKAKRLPLWRRYLESAPELGAIALIGPTYAAKMAEAGIADILTLRRRTSTKAGQRKLAAMVGLPASLVAEWAGVVGLAELERVGIPGANLLHDSGVRTCNALAASADAAALTSELAAYNDLTGRMDEAPDKALVGKWIAAAALECPPPPG